MGASKSDDSLLLDGLMRVEEFQEATGVRLDDDAHEGVETLGGLLAAVLGRIPEVGEEIVIGGRRLRVEARDGLRVETVRCLPRATAANAPVSSRSRRTTASGFGRRLRIQVGGAGGSSGM